VHAIRGRGLVEMHVFLGNGIGELAQRRDIVENPERASVRGQHEIVVFDDQIVDRRDRQVDLQRAPVRSVVEGDEDAALGAGIEQAFSLSGLLLQRDERSIGNAGGDAGPRRSVIGGLVDVGARSSF
jgi:hypothetical protein